MFREAIDSEGHNAGDAVPVCLPSLVRSDGSSESLGHLRLRQAQPKPGLFEIGGDHFASHCKSQGPRPQDASIASHTFANPFCGEIAGLSIVPSGSSTRIIYLWFPSIISLSAYIFPRPRSLSNSIVASMRFSILFASALGAPYLLSDYSIRESRTVVKRKNKCFIYCNRMQLRPV